MRENGHGGGLTRNGDGDDEERRGSQGLLRLSIFTFILLSHDFDSLGIEEINSVACISLVCVLWNGCDPLFSHTMYTYHITYNVEHGTLNINVLIICITIQLINYFISPSKQPH